ncbi:hypothetical protein CROQUDRAFT_670242 [Cronartium quercuum f. sp. fusiforme G11]|uniref:Uncharacterized protein n=1 Tax=Cronartium quercuum f. sp. fusiforme G11 TaxID=708437 RepID=A0A9P6NJ59_9BASI|nr:hypothetical protein CROQUDRAFT_670242 [Cronartium quercuum f. sp. fusiforme G11]
MTSEKVKSANQAGFDAIKKDLPLNLQNKFNASEGPNDLNLNRSQKKEYTKAYLKQMEEVSNGNSNSTNNGSSSTKSSSGNQVTKGSKSISSSLSIQNFTTYFSIFITFHFFLFFISL